MVGPCLASFPNSRIKSRSPTQTADTGNNAVVASNGVNSLPGSIRPANAARTYLTIRNNGAMDIRYGYVNRVTLWADGFLLKPGEAAQIDSQEEIFAATTSGLAPGLVNWDEGSG